MAEEWGSGPGDAQRVAEPVDNAQSADAAATKLPKEAPSTI